MSLPVRDLQLPKEKAGFCHGRQTTDQVTLLTQDIEDSFQVGKKAGSVFLDLTAAYFIVWLRGLHQKLPKTILGNHMVKSIMEMVSNHSFTLHTNDGQRSRLRRLRNWVPQGSVLATMLFNINIHYLPTTESKKYGYAEDLAILHSNPSWSRIEGGLSHDMTALSSYLTNWRLMRSMPKTMSTNFHLNNRQAKRQLNIKVDNNRLQFQTVPTYLSVKIDGSLTFKDHLVGVKQKISAWIALICRLAGIMWGAAMKTLRLPTHALVFSSTEYCALAWGRSRHTSMTTLPSMKHYEISRAACTKNAATLNLTQ